MKQETGQTVATQSEGVLEQNLIKQLAGLGYEEVVIKDEAALLANLKSQLEKHNDVTLTDNEFKKVVNHLSKGSVFEKAKILRDKMQLTKDNGENVYLEFIQQEHWCQNEFQVTHQITMEGSYKNRYDVTLLVNGLPLVQIELKRRGIEIKEAFNQINRYQRHSFAAKSALFQYVQIFVISNGVNTKYYANNKHQTFKQTFYWSDKDNKACRRLEAFAKTFLEPCNMSKMVTKYIVLHESDKILMILRPYQYHAVEAIVERVKNTDKNGYIWHTTGSGKTLTSFKASQILMALPKVKKVVFVVDRKDLDYQTTKEFNYFSEGSIDGTDSTKALVNQFADDTKLIVTTIQKLNNAIHGNKPHFMKAMQKLQDKHVVFIFDECHRSQFGETHKRIKAFFGKAQMFGFTGTPIFAKNAVKNEFGKRTTTELFEKCLHKYVITDAINDENVLKFSIEYVGQYKQKDSNTAIDIEVEAIDTQELMNSPDRLGKITDYIVANHQRKTHSKDFTAIFCVSSIDTLITYYQLFKQRKDAGEHNLKIATIFSYTSNEADRDANGFIPDESIEQGSVNKHSREHLDAFIDDYNEMFGSKYSTKDTQSYYNYYNDISKRVKKREIDILLVVNMFLTGFDSKTLNTLYVDKNLKYHGLIQAYSRTNRILGEKKSQGNIVSFRNLKKATDDAIQLFSNKDAIDIILMRPYKDYVQNFTDAVTQLHEITPTVDSVDDLLGEEQELAFVQAFREIMRVKNTLSTFSDFEFNDLAMSEQDFEDYKSKYLDLYDKVRTGSQKEKVSILDDVDFELELIHRDEINVSYILKLLAKLKDTNAETYEKQKKEIMTLLDGETSLRSKRELIERFIEKNIPNIKDADEVDNAFEVYWSKEKAAAFDTFCEEEKLDQGQLRTILENYLFTERKPLRKEIVSALLVKPKVLERKTVVERVTNRLVDFVSTFINGMF